MNTAIPINLTTRRDFGKLLVEMGLVKYAVEVGTHHGDFAKQLLSTWPGMLCCIDPWFNLPGYELQAMTLSGNGDRDKDYEICKKNLAQFGSRVVLMRTTSREAVRTFSDETLDFVYLDANHEALAIRQDLASWWHKVKVGGILAGSDFDCPSKSDFHWRNTIKPEVLQFAALRELSVYLTEEPENLPQSWYIVKEVS